MDNIVEFFTLLRGNPNWNWSSSMNSPSRGLGLADRYPLCAIADGY